MTPARLELRSRGALRRLLVFAEYIDSPSTRLDSGYQHGPTDAQRQAMMVRHRQECVRNPLQIRGDGRGGRQLNHEISGSTFGQNMEPTDLKSNHSARLPGGRMSLDGGE